MANLIKAEFVMDPVNIDKIRKYLKGLPEQLTDIEIRNILVSENAIFSLPMIIRDFTPKRVLLVTDPVPYTRLGQEVKTLVKEMVNSLGCPVEQVVLQPGFDGLVHASVENAYIVCSKISGETAVVSVGAGSITDIAKHACYLFTQSTGERVRAFIVVQTANTVTAFTSNMAVLLKDGVKRTFPSRFPDVIISDLSVLSEAPLKLTRAGIGDMVAKFVCYGDWYLAYSLGLAPTYSEVPLMIMQDLDRVLMEYAGEIGRRSPAGMEVLAKALFLGGLAMSVVNETTPLSGLEHVISHVLDMTAEFYGRGLALHGSQVGVSSIISSAVFDILLNEFNPYEVSSNLQLPSDEEAYQKVTVAFSPVDPTQKMAQECWRDYVEKLNAWRRQREIWSIFINDWETQIKPKLASLVRKPEDIVTTLRKVGAPVTFEELEPPVSENEGKFAFESAHFIRKRTTVADLIYFLGWAGPSFTSKVFTRAQLAINHNDKGRGCKSY